MDDLVGTMRARGFASGALSWPLVRAGDLFELRYGKALVETSRRPGDVPVYGTNGQCGWHDSPLFKGPGVILGRKGQGPLGVEWTDVDFWVIDTAYSLAVRRADVHLRFAFYLIKYIGLNHLKDGTSNPTLSRDTFGAQLLPLPPLREQVRITNVLLALDAKIELNRQMNDTLEEMARALFNNWFVDADRDDVNTWRQAALGDLVTLQRGTTYQGSLVGMPGPALLGLGSIEPGGGFREGRYKTYGGECPEKLTLHPGDIFVALKGATKDGSMVGSVARVPPSVPSGRLTQDTVKLEFVELRDGVSSFTYRLLLTPEYRTYCAARITGSAQVGLSREDFLGYLFRLPPTPLLAKYEHVESVLMARKYAAEAESRTLTELRDLLLPKLLSGELRIRDAERAVEAVA